MIERAFCLLQGNDGAFIVNRFDLGVAWQTFNTGSHDGAIINMVKDILDVRKLHYGNDVTVIDAGANIGPCTVGWGRHMLGWGRVIAFEPQEWVYYALAGNVAINNLYNVKALNIAVSDKSGMMKIPMLNPCKPTNFGGLSLKAQFGDPMKEQQSVSYDDDSKMMPVHTLAIDDLKMARVDLIKIDVEGMEPEALDGAVETITRCRPMMFIEHIICGKDPIMSRLKGYEAFEMWGNLLLLHNEDRATEMVKTRLSPS